MPSMSNEKMESSLERLFKYFNEGQPNIDLLRDELRVMVEDAISIAQDYLRCSVKTGHAFRKDILENFIRNLEQKFPDGK